MSEPDKPFRPEDLLQARLTPLPERVLVVKHPGDLPPYWDVELRAIAAQGERIHLEELRAMLERAAGSPKGTEAQRRMVASWFDLDADAVWPPESL